MRGGYVDVAAERLVASQLEACAVAAERSEDDSSAMIDALRAVHLSTTSAMVVALEGSVGVGALRTTSAAKTLKWISANDFKALPPKEITLSFLELIDAVQQPGRLEFSEAIHLSDYEMFWLRELSRLRDDIEHPKPTRWSVAMCNFDECLRHAAALIVRLIPAAAQCSEATERDRIQEAARRVLRAIGPPRWAA